MIKDSPTKHWIYNTAEQSVQTWLTIMSEAVMFYLLCNVKAQWVVTFGMYFVSPNYWGIIFVDQTIVSTWKSQKSKHSIIENNNSFGKKCFEDSKGFYNYTLCSTFDVCGWETLSKME